MVISYALEVLCEVVISQLDASGWRWLQNLPIFLLFDYRINRLKSNRA